MLPFAANWHMGDIRVRTQPISCVKNALVRLLSPHSGQRHFERWYQSWSGPDSLVETPNCGQ